MAKVAARAAPTASSPARPAAASAARPSAQNLLNQYQANVSRAGAGTEGNPMGDFMRESQQAWNAMQPLRAEGDRLRAGARGHEKTMLGLELTGQQAVAGIGANAQKAVAGIGADASKFSSRVGADTEKYLGRLNLQGTQVQTKGRIKEAQIGAKAQIGVAGIGADAQKYQADKSLTGQKYVADIGLQSDLAGYGSNERIAAGDQAGQNYRAGLNLAGSLLMNKDDNYTQRQGQLYDYTARVAATQWKAPDTTDIRYWS
jgi:hypothetical protein